MKMGNLRLNTLMLLLVVGVMSQDPSPLIYRLPSTVIPKMYMIMLDPDMDTGVIQGSVRIEVITTTSDQNQTWDSITLHAGTDVLVNGSTATLISMSGSVQRFGAVISDDNNTLVTLKLQQGQTISPNQLYVISLDFQSRLYSEPKGLFTGFFNTTSKYIASNLRPTHAREVFPCFDEPQFKVPVALQVWRPESYNATSTASIVSSSDVIGGKVLDTFANTDPISIHSLGLFISQQQPVASMGVNVVVPPFLNTSVAYLNTLISSIVKDFNPFPVPLNLVVLPDLTYTSFSSFGFVFTSPEVYLGQVGSPLQWTSLQLQLTEEFLRQYLEYSKTPIWWSDIWLSESVGAYLALYYQQNEPWLSDWLNIVVRSNALGAYTSASGPVVTTGNLTKWDIENLISDQTVKVKGLSTFLMWNATMPIQIVRKTLKQFISLDQSVVSTTDLFTLMVKNINNSKSSYDVRPTIPLLGNWLLQPSSPLVWFSIESNSTFNLIQGTPCSANGSASALRPISIAVATGPSPDWTKFMQGQWLLNSSSQYEYDNISTSSVINIESAPFRVNYPPSQWSTLISDLASGWAPASVASTLQDDAVALSLSGCLDFSIALSLLSNVTHSGLDWWPVVKATEAITSNIGGDWYGFSAYAIYFESLFTPALLEDLDMRNSANHSELTVARELVTPWLCRFNISTCREAAVELGMSLWQGNTSGIAGSDLENVACYGARYTPGAMEPLMSAYQNASSAWLRRYYTIALSCLTDPDSVNGLLFAIMNSNSSSRDVLEAMDSQTELSQSDAQQILLGLASSLENSQTIINFILTSSTSIESKFGVDTLSSMIKNLARNRVDLSQLSSLQSTDMHVKQSISEAMAASNSSQTWFTNYSAKLYQVLPTGQVVTTTTTPSTTSASTSTPYGTSTTSKPKPSSAPDLSHCQALTLALLALLVTLNFTL